MYSKINQNRSSFVCYTVSFSISSYVSVKTIYHIVFKTCQTTFFFYLFSYNSILKYTLKEREIVLFQRCQFFINYKQLCAKQTKTLVLVLTVIIQFFSYFSRDNYLIKCYMIALEKVPKDSNLE